MTASTLSTRELRNEWADWLTKVFEGQPTSLVTLTFAPRPWECDSLGALGPTNTRVLRAAYRFEKSLTASVGRPSFFIVRELGGMNGRGHLHSIVSGLERSSTRAAIASHVAREGFGKLSTVTMTPAEYVTKYVSKSDTDFWLAGGPLFGARVVSDGELVRVGVQRVHVGRPRSGGNRWMM